MKASTLRAAIRDSDSVRGRQRFEIDVASLTAVPRSPSAYWVSDRLQRVFAELRPFVSDALHHRACRAALAKEVGPPHLVHDRVGVLHDVELFIDDSAFGQSLLDSQPERIPH